MDCGYWNVAHGHRCGCSVLLHGIRAGARGRVEIINKTAVRWKREIRHATKSNTKVLVLMGVDVPPLGISEEVVQNGVTALTRLGRASVGIARLGS